MLAFCFVIFSHKLPIGELAALGAVAAALSRDGKLEVPSFYRWYLLYLFVGLLGVLVTPYRPVVLQELMSVAKIALIGLAAFNILTTPKTCRIFIIGYLALFALFPVRGSFYNYLHGITEQGRIAWNFFFRNPNDLAMACFLPIGLCAYLLYTETKNKWIRGSAFLGLIALIGVQLLTQSRGAILSLAVAVLYVLIHSRHRLRVALCIAGLIIVAALLTPSSVWQRVSGLSNFVEGDITQVDPEQSAAGRATVMRLALGVATHNPQLGIGLGAYAYEHARITRDNFTVGKHERGMVDAHSAYIRAAAETGWIGAAAVVLFVGSAIVSCRNGRLRIQRNAGHQREAMALLMVEASMVAFAIGALFNSAERSTFFMLQFVIPWILMRSMVPAGVRSNERKQKRSVVRSDLSRRGPGSRGKIGRHK